MKLPPTKGEKIILTYTLSTLPFTWRKNAFGDFVMVVCIRIMMAIAISSMPALGHSPP